MARIQELRFKLQGWERRSPFDYVGLFAIGLVVTVGEFAGFLLGVER